MAVRFSITWLLIGIAFVVQLPVTRGQLCSPDWTFHSLTGSCMALIRKSKTYGDAKYYCQYNFKSSTTKRDGHLVFIFDKATDDFVKGLLDEQGVDRALIGLQDRASNGYYAWGDHNAIPADYTGWEDNPHTADPSKRAVVTTKDGWQEYDERSATYFVCQASVNFPTPTMTCPVAELGEESLDIRCTTDTHQPFSITGVRFMKTEAVVASCDANRCWSGLGYGQAVDVSKPPDTGSSASWTLKLRNVRISDATGWSCSVEFSNSGYWVASQPCSLNVYTKLRDIQCDHQFVQRKAAMITCAAAQVYPQVNCTWKVNYLKRPLAVYDQTVSNASGYYRTKCTASFDVNNAGLYNVTVGMVSTLTNFRIEGVKETSVSVAPPQESPQLSLAGETLQSSWVNFVENQTLTLTCQITGGDPQVYRTIITCDNIPQPFMSDDSSVTMNVRVTRGFNGRSCTCSALHAASYTQTSSVEIRVAYPATITLFRITRRYNSTDIKSGDQITFSCEATGNPMSYLIVQRQNGPTLNHSSTGDITYKKTATCSDTGSYVCLASNMVQGQHHQDSQVAHLQVKCAPEHCSGTSRPKFPAAVGATSASFKICVRAYPAPTSFILYKGNTTDNRLKEDKFQAYFNFTNEEDGLGEITVMITPFTQADIGDYMLYSEYKLSYRRDPDFYSHLKFSVFAQGPPMCPTNFTFVKADPDSVTLSWIPGFDGGVNQTFTVLRIDSPSDTSSSSPGFTMLGTVEDQEDSSVYAVTGLSESTTYMFGLEVRNGKGSGNCSHLQVTVSTSASPSALSGAVVTVVVAAGITVLFLVILVVAVLVVVRRRRGRVSKKSVYMSDTARTGAGDTSRAGSSGAGETSQLAFNDNGGDNVYANTVTRGTNAEGKNVKAAKKTSKEEDDSNTYAQVNKQDKKAQKARKRPDKKQASEHGQESLYSRFARNINLKGHKKLNTEQVYNELADVYQNVSNVGVPDSSAAADPDNVYANVKASSPNKQENTQEKKKNNYRTVNDDGLVYVSVEINKKTTYPEIVSVKKPVGTVSPMTTNAEPEVEYIAINCAPGVKQQ